MNNIQGPLIHLICGSTGAGKTTYARQLCAELRGVSFSIDEWMTSLFWMDSPQPPDATWSIDRVERCLQQIWHTALQVAARGVPCVLDVGFASATMRARFFKLARDAGFATQLHFLDVPVAERWRRIQSRNSSRGDTYQLPFDVTREMFDFVETLWEPPSERELLVYDRVRRSVMKG